MLCYTMTFLLHACVAAIVAGADLQRKVLSLRPSDSEHEVDEATSLNKCGASRQSGHEPAPTRHVLLSFSSQLQLTKEGRHQTRGGRAEPGSRTSAARTRRHIDRSDADGRSRSTFFGRPQERRTQN